MSGPGDGTYVAHDLAAGLRAGLPALGIGVVGAAVFLLVFDHRVQAGLALVVFAGAAVVSGRRASRPLVVDPRGLTFNPGRSASVWAREGVRWVGWRVPRSQVLPWPHVLRVEVVRADEVVRVVLHRDAPMPWWVRSRVYDPADPDAGVRLEEQVPRLDPVALERAVAVQAPHVTVVPR